MNKTTFRVGCDLNYQVSGPSAFIFNVGVVTNSFQRVLDEQFITAPVYQVQETRPTRGKKTSSLFLWRRGRFGSLFKPPLS